MTWQASSGCPYLVGSCEGGLFPAGERVFEMGGEDLLVKPVARATLCALVARIKAGVC
jgi:hypothetical protein